MTRLELSIAWRYLRSRGTSRLFSFISVIAMGGVVVGVSALIVINGVMTGMQGELREKILVGSPDIRVLTLRGEPALEHWEGALDTVRKQPGVVAAAPFVLTQGLATSGHDYFEGVFVAGIEPEPRVRQPVTDIRQFAVQGDFRFASSDGKTRGAVLGRRLAERLNAYPGDTITLVTAQREVQRGRRRARPAALTVSRSPASSRTGMYEYDNSYVYVPLDVAQEFAALGTAVTGIEMRTADRWKAPEVAGRIADKLGFPYRVQDWQEQNSQLFQALKLEKLGMRVILLLIVLVAAFNIVSTLTMVVADKTREIGILKAMGMRARVVRRIFLLQGLVIGAVGTAHRDALGAGRGRSRSTTGASSAWTRQVYFIDHLPVRIDPLEVAVHRDRERGHRRRWPRSTRRRRRPSSIPVEAIRHE